MVLLDEQDGEVPEDVQSLQFDDLETYFNQQSITFVDIPCKDKHNSETDTDCGSDSSSDTYISDDSDMEI